MKEVIVCLCVLCLLTSCCVPAYAMERTNVVAIFEYPAEENTDNACPSLEMLGAEEQQAAVRAYAATEDRAETIKNAFLFVCIIFVVSTVIQFFNQ